MSENGKPEQRRLIPERFQYDGKNRKSRQKSVSRWFYVRSEDSARMRGAGPDGLGLDWYPLDMRSPRIMLFSNRCLARREARRCGGKVAVFTGNPSPVKGIF